MIEERAMNDQHSRIPIFSNKTDKRSPAKKKCIWNRASEFVMQTRNRPYKLDGEEPAYFIMKSKNGRCIASYTTCRSYSASTLKNGYWLGA